MLNGVATFGVIVVLSAGGAVAGAAGGKRVIGAHFATTAPAGWSVASRPASGGRQFVLAAPRVKLDGAGVPKSTGMGVTILEVTKGKRLPSSPTALLRAVVRLPSGAKSVKRGVVRAMAFHGTAGAQAGFTYIYRKRRILQQDYVVARGGRVYVIESHADTAKALLATGALTNVTGPAWTWR